MAAEQAGRATMQASVNPALAASPNADGSTPPVSMESIPPPSMPPNLDMAAAEEGMDPAGAIINALSEGSPPPQPPVQGG